MKIPISIIIMFLSILLGCDKPYKDDSTNSAFEKNGRVSHLCEWDTGVMTYICAITSKSESLWTKRTLSVYDTTSGKHKEVFSYATIDVPLALFQIGESKGKLVTIWMAGSAYHICIFSDDKRKITKVLDEGSKVYPEFVYFDNINENAIVLTDLDWKIIGSTNERELIPVSARIFRWINSNYELKKAPWKNRFN